MAPLCFQPCDVTQPLNAPENRKVGLRGVQLILFFYVCHETSIKARAGGLQFYIDVATEADAGAVVVLADVKERSRADLALVVAAMRGVRTLVPLATVHPHSAEVMAFRLEGAVLKCGAEVAAAAVDRGLVAATAVVVANRGRGSAQRNKDSDSIAATVVQIMAPAFKF